MVDRLMDIHLHVAEEASLDSGGAPNDSPCDVLINRSGIATGRRQRMKGALATTVAWIG